ncbi:MAG: NAD(P)-binding domain-containing protein [Leptospiraceae bacterium]|nr:NAD(P)-binding domain-containing protein [Leptospiraceae bacterium]
MKIAIIGAGNVGGALAKNWKAKGHNVCLGVRNPESSKLKIVLDSFPEMEVRTIEEAILQSEVIVLATPSKAAKEIAESIKDLVKDKIIIDTMNSVGSAPEGFKNTFELIHSITKSNSIVKCFNSTGAENMGNPKYPDSSIDMFMAGSNESAKAIVRTLALDAGFAECYDFGGNEQVQILENFALVWINLAMKQGMGRNFGFKILKR